MTNHPENEAWVNELDNFVKSMEVVDVWCTGCNSWRKMNARYAKYLSGEIESCSECGYGVK